MADLSTLKAAADQLTTDVAEAVDALRALAVKVGEGGNVDQAELDAIAATLTGASTNLDAAVAETDGDPATPPVEDGTQR